MNSIQALIITMDNRDLAIEHYKRIPTVELVLIARDPAALDPEVIPHLQSELLNRNEKEEALLLSEFLLKSPRPFKDLTRAELAEKVRERLDAGEPIESIKLDLRDKGIDIFNILDSEARLKDKTFDYLTSLKEEGLDETQIDEKLKMTFGIDETEADILKRQLKKKGMQNLVIGYSLVILTILIGLLVVEGGGRVTIWAILLIGLGAWRIAEGYRQRR